MADLKELFSKFHTNRIKHQRRYEFTIEKVNFLLKCTNLKKESFFSMTKLMIRMKLILMKILKIIIKKALKMSWKKQTMNQKMNQKMRTSMYKKNTVWLNYLFYKSIKLNLLFFY